MADPVPLNNFGYENYVIFPVPGPTGALQRWVMVQTGIAVIDFKGESSEHYTQQAFSLQLGNLTDQAIRSTGRKPSEGYALAFQADQWAASSSINSVHEPDVPAVAFFTDRVDTNLTTMGGKDRIYLGLGLNVGVRGVGAYLFRVGFQVTLFGKIVEIPGP